MPLYGRVAALQLFRPPGEPRDLLLLLTERHKFCVLAYDEEAGGRICGSWVFWLFCLSLKCQWFMGASQVRRAGGR